MSITMNKKLANIVVIMNWVLFAIFVICYVVLIAGALIFFDDVALKVTEIVQKDTEEKLTDEEVLKAARYVLTITLGIFVAAGLVGILIQMALNILLTKGVNQSERRKLNIWLVIHLIFFILGALSLLIRVFQVFSGKASIFTLLGDIISIVWLGICLFIIKNLRDDLGASVTYGGVVYAKADTNPAV